MKKSYTSLRRLKDFAYLFLCAVCVQTVTAQSIDDAKFVPKTGKLLTIGQDVDSINGYNSSVGMTPAGVVGYTGVDSLAGLLQNGDWGAGRNNFSELARTYPNSVLVLGVAMNGQLGAVNNGSLDNNINTIIDTLVSYNRPVFLRWGYEVDGPWNAHDPNQFIQAWRRVYNMIQTRGNAKNHIAMVWQVASYCGGTYNGLHFSSWYPGDQYVDWIGLSYFTPQDCNWSLVNEAAQFSRSHNKPLFVNESAPQRYDIEDLTYSSNPTANERLPRTATQIWSEWYAGYFNFINNTYNDVIKAVTYINADWDSQPRWGFPYREGYWGNSEVQDNSQIRNSWLTEVTQSRWIHASSTLFDSLGFDPSGNPDPDPDPDPNPGSYVFGIDYINDNQGTLYHVLTHHTGGFVYICLNADCRPPQLMNGRWEYPVNVTPGNVYSLEFKVQDNTIGQCITTATVNYTRSGGGTEYSVCAN